MTPVLNTTTSNTTNSSSSSSSSSSNSNRKTVSVTLKWSKQVFQFDLLVGAATSAASTSTSTVAVQQASSSDGGNVVVVVVDDDDDAHVNADNKGAVVPVVMAVHTGLDLKRYLYNLTKVPIERQKILVTGKKKKYWKGALLDTTDLVEMFRSSDDDFDRQLSLTLLGTAEVLTKPTATTTMSTTTSSPQEPQNADGTTTTTTTMASTGRGIPAIQWPVEYRYQHSNRRPDEIVEYDRLVHGLSQTQIEELLQSQTITTNNQKKQDQDVENMEEDGSNAPIARQHSSLLGKVVMTMGLQLQRAYVNDLAVLYEDADMDGIDHDDVDSVQGTLVSGLEDGHVQLWRHGQRVADVVHHPLSQGFATSNSQGGVDSVLALTGTHRSTASFATAGRNVVRLWTSDAEPLGLLPGGPGPMVLGASPTSLVQLDLGGDTGGIGIAARYDITMPSPQRHLTPQDDAGRQRVALMQAQEEMLHQTLYKWSRSIQVWYRVGTKGSATIGSFQSAVLEIPNQSAFVTALASWQNDSSDDDNNRRGGGTILAAGDSAGGIHLWRMSSASNTSSIRFELVRSYQLVSNGPNGCFEAPSAVACMKFDRQRHQLLVSTRQRDAPHPPSINYQPTDIAIPPATSQAVHILDVSNIDAVSLQMSLNGHKDVVNVMLPLPNGDLLTGGGKYDATLQLWSAEQLLTSTARRSIEDDENGTKTATPQVLAHAANPNLGGGSGNDNDGGQTNTADKVGYVFALAVLKDLTPGSDHFAIAAARYNVIKVLV